MAYNQHSSYAHGQGSSGNRPQAIANRGPNAPQQNTQHRQYYQPLPPSMIHPSPAAGPSTNGHQLPISYRRVSTQQGPPRTKPFDWGTLAPGKLHQLSIDIAPSPQAIMDGSYQRTNELEEKDFVIYVPRRAEFCTPPSIPSILFSVNGKPGPYIRDVAKGRAIIDGGADQIFRATGWKQTLFMIEWPGTESSKEAISCFSETGEPTTRAKVATHLSIRLRHFFLGAKDGQLRWGPQHLDKNTKDWNLAELDYSDVRLMGMNYYRNQWIPVLAMDAISNN